MRIDKRTMMRYYKLLAHRSAHITSAPAQRVGAQSFTCRSPPAPHARLGSKLGARSRRIDHF